MKYFLKSNSVIIIITIIIIIVVVVVLQPDSDMTLIKFSISNNY